MAKDPNRSDALMIQTLGQGTQQAQQWEAILPKQQDRVALHKLKMGTMKWTRYAHGQRLQLWAPWKRMAKEQKADLQQCPCGAGKQTAAHIWQKCSIARGVLKEGMARGHIQGGAQAWDALPLDKQLYNVLAPDRMTGSAQALALKRESIQAFLKAAEKVKGALGCSQRRFKDEVEALSGCFVQL